VEVDSALQPSISLMFPIAMPAARSFPSAFINFYFIVNIY
jgi:hypothetical protein